MDHYRKTLVLLWSTLLAIVVMVFVNRLFEDRWPSDMLDAVMHNFILDAEQNIPTWFSSVLLLLGGAGWLWLASIDKHKSHPDRWRYLALAGMFFYMSCDETAVLHELLSGPIKQRMEVGGLTYHAWTMVGLAVVVTVSVVMWPMLRRLSPSLRRFALVAGAVYVGGGLVIESLGGALAERTGKQSFRYFLVSTLEETMEMSGAMLLVTGFIREMRIHHAALPAVSADSQASPAVNRAA